MKNSKEIFSFSANEIRYVKKIKASGKINTSQGDMIQNIIRTRVNSSFNMCTSCSGAISKNFNKIVKWIEIFIGCDIDEFSEDKAEGLIKDGEKKLKEKDLTIEQEKNQKKKDKEKEEKKEANRRERKRKKEEEAQKKITEERRKKRESLEKSRLKKQEEENERLEKSRLNKKKEKEEDELMCRKAIKVLLEGEFDLLTKREELKEVGSILDIVAYMEKTTGLKIETEDKSEEYIFNEALTTNRKIAEFARLNVEEIDEMQESIELERQNKSGQEKLENNEEKN